ncbi:hypothetical protein D3C75_1103740 [compost metagenome]
MKHTPRFRILDHGVADPVLDAACRIEVFQLGQKPRGVRETSALRIFSQLQKRGVSDQIRQAFRNSFHGNLLEFIYKSD